MFFLRPTKGQVLDNDGHADIVEAMRAARQHQSKAGGSVNVVKKEEGREVLMGCVGGVLSTRRRRANYEVPPPRKVE